MTFTGTQAPQPPNLSLKARLSWKYFFDGGWAVVKAGDCYICCDEALNLSTATGVPDEDTLISWLEAVATDHLESDRIGFLSLFCSIPELITDTVAREMEKLINEAPE